MYVHGAPPADCGHVPFWSALRRPRWEAALQSESTFISPLAPPLVGNSPLTDTAYERGNLFSTVAGHSANPDKEQSEQRPGARWTALDSCRPTKRMGWNSLI